MKNRGKALQNGLKCAEPAILKTISNRTKNINDAEKTGIFGIITRIDEQSCCLGKTHTKAHSKAKKKRR